MKAKNSLGVYIFILLILLFIPSYLHYQYSNYIKTSKAHLIYDHNKNYNRKMAFPDENVYKIFNNSVKGNVEQITFTDVTLKSQKETYKISLSGDKPYFTIIENNIFKQVILNYFYNNFEQRNYLLGILLKNKSQKDQRDGLLFRTILIPYLPSFLGHLKAQKNNNNEYLIAFGENIITANISTYENGLISAISNTKYFASYSNYFEKKGVQIPKEITINNTKYNLKNIKMNVINTHR